MKYEGNWEQIVPHHVKEERSAVLCCQEIRRLKIEKRKWLVIKVPEQGSGRWEK